MTKTELNKYRGLNAELRQISGWISEMESLSRSPGGQHFSRMPTGPAESDRTMDAIIDKHQKLLRMYREKILQIQNQIFKIEKAIDSLEDPTERAILRFRYISCYKWERIAKEMSYCVRQVQMIHGYALMHLNGKK